MRNLVKSLSAICACTGFVYGQAIAAEALPLREVLRPAQVCSITADWIVGVRGDDDQVNMIETVRKAAVGDKSVWRAIHHPASPSERFHAGQTGYDEAVVTAETLAPVRA